MKDALVVEIEDMKLWSQGCLLRYENGNGRVVDERACLQAQDILDKGGKVLLANNGRLTGTYLKLENGSYVEKRRRGHAG